ncbi:uncharacterized protein A1O9_00033 [Exophiala aquamarina CBS 119918]|uniref:Oxidoreductase n=1 Tax=Exophiala aquamarina CBS 119918 TaxID=1182545 RepID=A0A072PQA1_9EURO|nr:uncharacterized protein A1O9_00033 [Exophiala aquamarina CBS 119918]KEF62061.1 hypothetical protein A1O9_00033 [Exophiala aquamarina CBS 119918]
MSLNDKVIAITGAASGIGLAVAEMVATLGGKLALADIDEMALHKTVTSLKSQGYTVIGDVVDVASSNAVDAWIGGVLQQFGRLDGAANIAGVQSSFQNVEDFSNDAWDRVIAVNLTGVMYCVRAQIRAMKNGGSIVNAASLAGVIGRPGISAYSSSKHGVVGLTKTAAKEVGVKGIRVNAVAPGPIATPMLDQMLKGPSSSSSSATTSTYSSLPLKRIGTAEEVAKLVAFLLSDDSSYITGTVVNVDGGAAA